MLTELNQHLFETDSMTPEHQSLDGGRIQYFYQGEPNELVTESEDQTQSNVCEIGQLKSRLKQEVLFKTVI